MVRGIINPQLNLKMKRQLLPPCREKVGMGTIELDLRHFRPRLARPLEGGGDFLVREFIFQLPV